MDTVRQALDGDEIIPVHILQDLGRQSLRKTIKGNDQSLSLSHLEQLWTKLRNTARSTDVTDRHLRACCNAVCVFLTCTAQSEQQEVRQIAFSSSTWSHNLDIVHKSFIAGRGKAAMQVMETSIQLLLENPDQDAACKMLRCTVNEMMRLIITGSSEPHLKESCIMLSHFLHKTRNMLPFPEYFSGLDAQANLEFSRLCKQHQIAEQQLDREDIMITKLFLALLFIADVAEAHTAALKLFSYLCTLQEDFNCPKHTVYANEAITIYLSSNPDALPDFSKHVLPAVINTKEQFVAFLKPRDSIRVSDLNSLYTFLAIVEVGRQKSFVNEDELASLFHEALQMADLAAYEWTTEPKQDMSGFDTLLSCKEPGLRLQALSLLTTSPLTNANLPRESLSCLANNLKHIHDDSDAYYRDEFTSILRRFLERFGRSAAAAHRDERKGDRSQMEELTVVRYRRFMDTYLKFLKSELSPNTSYPRHILALQTLHHMFAAELSIVLDEHMNDTVCTLIDPLLSLVLDPFEDVRRESALILESINTRIGNASLATMKGFHVLAQAQTRSASTHRGDHADALGRLHMLSAKTCSESAEEHIKSDTRGDLECQHLCELVHDLESHVRSVNHLGPANPFPLHGFLLGVVYCVDSLNYSSSSNLTPLKTRILNLCMAIWHLVQEELCVDTPERTTESFDHDELIGPKDLLAYSWRALRDSSLILQSLLKSPHEGSAIDLYEKIGDLCLEQLVKLRHRGAFSTVAQTFVLCCQKTRSCDDVNGSSLLYQRWYKAAFVEIEEQATKLTRRSAGLPAIFAALLDPNEPETFRKSVDGLVQIATVKPDASMQGLSEDDMKLPQVHALNCLKDIMLNSRFRSVSEPMVVTMLNLAAQCLASDIWAIRNCGLMLFRACIGRLTPESSLPSTNGGVEVNGIVKDTPLETAVRLLESAKIYGSQEAEALEIDASKSSEIVFAALDLLGRIPRQPSTESLVNSVYITQLGDRLWSVREHAARLRALNVDSGEGVTMVQDLLKNDSNSTPNLNALHGKLLCARFVLQEVWTSRTDETDKSSLKAISVVHRFAAEIFMVVSDPYVMAACVDILNDAYTMSERSSILHQQIHICYKLMSFFFDGRVESPNLYLLHRSICLNNTYHYLCVTSEAEQMDILQQQRQYDVNDVLATKHFSNADTALYVLGEVKGSTGKFDITLLQDFYLGAIVGKFPEDVRTVAMENLAQEFRTFGCRLSEFSLQRLQQNLDLQQPYSRGFFNAQIMLASHLINIVSDKIYAQTDNLATQLINALQECLCDEIETPTRYNAVLALQILIPHLLKSNSQRSKFDKADQFRVLCIMYDFLNDDDDEIRDAAIIATHEILLRHGRCHKLLPPCAAAAREELLALLAIEFGDTPEFRIRVCAVVLGAQTIAMPVDAGGLAPFCLENSVDSLLHSALLRADELFAEEKQNLYIDDIDEIMAWSASTTRSDLVMEAELFLTLQSWTLTGLQRLVSLIDVSTEQEGNIGPLGPSYNEDILIVFMRCITMASLLRRRQRSIGNDQELAMSCSINEHLVMLKDLAMEHFVHHKIIEALEAATS